MEIRRVEGIIPVEGINRDLPLKLENFSYHEMKRLLSQIGAGEQKGRADTEFESLLKAVFLGYEGKNRGRFKIGNTQFTAQLEIDRAFQPGEEVLLRLKGVGEKIEFSLVLPVKKRLSEVLKGELPNLLSKTVKFPDRELLSLLLPFVEREYPEVATGFRGFLVSEQIFSPYSIFSLLLLLKPEVRSELEKRGVKLPAVKEVKELINHLLGLYSLYALLGVLEIPIYIDGSFRGRVFYRRGKEELSQAFIEIDTALGEFGALLKLLGKNLSVEYWGSREVLERIDPEEVKKRLESAGLKPIVVRAVSKSEAESFKGEFFKGEGISVNLSV